jgi:hypothetical protein
MNDLFWVLYSDGDSEDMNESELRDAVHNHKRTCNKKKKLDQK